jgi:hypothetical protein
MDKYAPVCMLISAGYGISFSIAAQTDGFLCTQSVYAGGIWVCNNQPIGTYDLIPLFLTLISFIAFFMAARNYWGNVPVRN